MRGRPAGWNPFSDCDTSAWVEVAGIDAKQRLQLPVAVRRRLGWLTGTKELLAELQDEGCAQLIAWEPDGRRRVDAVRQELARLPAHARGERTVAAMDRYLRVPCEQGARLALPVNLRRHLDPDQTGRFWLVTYSGALWIWGDDQWAARRPLRLKELQAQA